MRHEDWTGYPSKCPCKARRLRHADYWRARKALYAETPFEQIPHGLNGYDAYSCRCETCKAAKRVANARRREPRPDVEIEHNSAPVQAA